MVDLGMTHVVIEATSHGLEQSRVAACYFDLGVVTNITHEHLDYHGDYDNYLRSKAKLLEGLLHGAAKKVVHTPTAILNHDDFSYQPLLDIISTFSQPIQTRIYGTSEGDHLSASDIQNLPDGLAFNLVMEGKQYPVRSMLIGEYNVYNILAAISAAYFGCGIDLVSAIRAINSFSGVPGRMEPIDLGQDFQAIVDFAHTPNALKVALETSRNRTENRVIAVFGSAGLRDREKRRMMAETSIKNADITVITAEDPRTENLDLILSEMKEEAIIHGGIEGKNLFIIPDRGEAIKSAVFLASEGDLVIACGKGHEQSMCFGETEYPWDDRIALRSALASLMGVEGPRMPYLPTQDQ
jgi:UDP-N-acetylmuramoyl-L-alanyl-D-glutamate--2,6-diaminopimelate ligase